jgi:hypothetical protein
LGNGLLGLFLIVPKVGRGEPFFDGPDFRLLAVEVKESPAVAEFACGCFRPDRSVRVP